LLMDGENCYRNMEFLWDDLISFADSIRGRPWLVAAEARLPLEQRVTLDYAVVLPALNRSDCYPQADCLAFSFKTSEPFWVAQRANPTILRHPKELRMDKLTHGLAE
jgi:hypothetical protein